MVVFLSTNKAKNVVVGVSESSSPQHKLKKHWKIETIPLIVQGFFIKSLFHFYAFFT